MTVLTSPATNTAASRLSATCSTKFEPVPIAAACTGTQMSHATTAVTRVATLVTATTCASSVCAELACERHAAHDAVEVAGLEVHEPRHDDAAERDEQAEGQGAQVEGDAELARPAVERERDGHHPERRQERERDAEE